MYDRSADEAVEALIEHDPLLASSWGFAVRPVPALDPDWWGERRRLWHAAEDTSDALLGPVAAAEVAWMDAAEFLRSVHATIDSPAFALRQCLDEMPVADIEGVENYVAVVASIQGALAGLTETLRVGISRGTVASRRQALASSRAVCAWTANVLIDRVEESVRAQMPATLDRDLRHRSAEAAAGFAEFATFLELEYAPVARDEDAAGRESFDLWAGRYFAEQPVSADWYEWATNELNGVMTDLADARRAADAAAPSEQIHGEDEHLAWVEKFIAHARQVMASTAPLPPGVTGPVVKVMPGEVGWYSTYYSPPKLDEPGTVWVEPGDGPHYVEYEKVLMAHEGVPGHHTETTHQRSAGRLSRFQQLAYLPAHSEGWALYAEQLADEAGLYDTPHSRAGYLGSLALRVASAAIDIGIHCGLRQSNGSPWSTTDATLLLKEVGLSGPVAASWLDGVLGRPGHRSTYAIGKRSWVRARNAARRTGVNDADFHRQTLAIGPCQLSQLITTPLTADENRAIPTKPQSTGTETVE